MFKWIAALWDKWQPRWPRPRFLQARVVEIAEPQPATLVSGGGLDSLEASCHPIAQARDDPWPARVRDISTGNIGLQLKRRFEPGTLLAVELQNAAQDYSRTLVARVTHARSEGAQWIIGCILASKLDPDEVQSLQV
jgi:hypothetical protein